MAENIVRWLRHIAAESRSGPTPATAYDMRRSADVWLSAAKPFLVNAPSLVVTVVGVLALLAAWTFADGTIATASPTWTVKPITALAFVLSGVGLAMLHPRGLFGLGKASIWLGRGGAALSALIGGLTLVEWGFGESAGLHWLIPQVGVAPAEEALGRMSPNAAFALLLLGLSLLFLPVETRRGRRPAELLALAAGLVAVLGFLGHIHGVRDFYALGAFPPMTFTTALTLLVLSYGVLMTYSGRGLMATVTADTSGGVMARVLVPVMIVILPSLGWLRTQGMRAGLWDLGLGSASVSMLGIAILVSIVLGCARMLNAADAGRLRTEAELRRNATELAASNHELEAFCYSVSHDLRAPLRAIAGFSQVLREKHAASLDEQGLRYLGKVCDESQQMGRLIDDLLQLSRVTRGELRRQRVDLSALARRIMAEHAQREPERLVDIKVEDGLSADGDERLLTLALENLMSNAWKFTSKKSRATIEIGSTRNGNTCVFFVKDDGAGFDMQYASKLFNPFQRLHGTAEFPGIGIGLATVQRVVRRHGGEIRAEGGVGKGATFSFTLAARENA